MAAGLGFKTFTTGEVLTAADTNGYLMQGVLVFASSAARAAAITSPQEGQYSYLKDTNSTEYYDGAAWIAAPIGDITGVTAGTGISGGGTSGTVTVTNSMATEITAAGDIIVGTGSGTFDNLPIGTTAQVLTADTTVSPYKVKWATPTAGGTVNWTAVNSGGTSLSGASTLTISSISGANYLLMTWLAASSDTINGEFEIQINGDTASNYYYGGTYAASGTTDWNGSGTSGTTRIRIGALPAINSDGYGYCLISGGNAAGVKAIASSMGSNRTGNFSSSVGGWWNNTATISSVTVKVTAGNFDGGSLYVFKSA